MFVYFQNRANREQSENGGESEEESEVDTHLLLRRINEVRTFFYFPSNNDNRFESD